MDFELTDEQRMLADSLRRYLQEQYTFERRRRIAREGGGFDRAAWSALADMGVLGLGIDGEYGGFGEGPASLAVVQHELGRALVLEPVTACAVMAAAVIGRHASAAQKARLLPAIAQGSCIVTPAWLEQGGQAQTRAHRSAEGYVLSGRKTLVWHGGQADALLVTVIVEQDDEPSMFLVERAAAGVTTNAYATLDGMSAADLILDNVAVPFDSRIGDEGAGREALQDGLDYGVAALCAEAAGAMERLIEITAEYLRTRQQFGRPLGAFQALQHRMADMVMQKELAISMAYVAAQALGEDDAAGRDRKLAAAKFMMAKAAQFVGREAVQLHGGMGMTDELMMGDYFKRLTSLTVLLGNGDHHLARYAALLEA